MGSLLFALTLGGLPVLLMVLVRKPKTPRSP
jgi:hypothetical protein